MTRPFPRPRGRGPIEAWRQEMKAILTKYFRDRAVAAPLKRVMTAVVLSVFHVFPRPRGRGPIEALCLGVRHRRNDIFPRPRGRGPIEARRSQMALTRLAAHFLNEPTSISGYSATLSLIPSFGAFTRSCLVPRYRSVADD